MRAYSLLLIGVSILWTVSAFGAVLPPQVQWEKVYGGETMDRMPCLVRTSDGGFILGGHSWSGVSGNKNTPNYGEEDFWVLRLDANGNKIWEGTFGGAAMDLLWDLKETWDGGCILVGESWSPASGNKTAPRIGFHYNFWVVRLNASGNLLWDRTFNTNLYTQARSVVQTADGGFLVGGTADRADYWLVRLDAEGNKLWDRAYGGSGEDHLTDLRQTPDGGFILAGYSDSPQGPNKSGAHYGGADVWLVRIDSAGNKLWDRTYGGDGDDGGRRVIQTQDGGFVVAASTMSGISGSKTTSFQGGIAEWGDYWILKVDAQGNQLWDADFGGAGTDACTDVLEMLDGGLLVAGATGSTNQHIWIVRLDGAGNEIWDQHYYDGLAYLYWPSIQATPDGGVMVATDKWGDPGEPRTGDLMLFKLSPETVRGPVPPPRIEWQRTFGGTSNDWPYSIVQTPDGGCVVAGDSYSLRSGNKDSGSFGRGDGWVIRLNAQGNKLWETNLGGTGYEMFLSVQNTRDGGFVVAGESSSPPSGNKTSEFYGVTDFWVVRLDSNGNKVWDKSFGGSHEDRAFTIVPTSDGGFLVGGSSYSPADGNKTSSPFTNASGMPPWDYWVVRLDGDGNKLWDRTYGGSYWETLTDAQQIADGGFLLAGVSGSDRGGSKTSTNFSTAEDFWIVRTDASGNTLWDKTYGGDGGEQALKVIMTPDGGSLVGGATQSGIGGNKSAPFHGGFFDYWVVRLDANGNKLWDRGFGGHDWDLLGGLYQSADGGFVISGCSRSPMSGNKSSPLLQWSDMWVVRLDRYGQKLWEQTYNGTHSVGTGLVCPAKDGGCFLAGGAQTSGGADFLIMKLSPDPLVTPRLENTVRTGNDLRFALTGIAGRTYVTEWSSDLRKWSALGTNRLMSRAVEIVDGAGEGKRFYRARMVE